MDLSFIDRTYLINLDRRTDRLEAVQEKLREACFPFIPKRVRAVDGGQVTVPRWFRSGPGAWGCARSHLQILEEAQMDQLKCIMILEDDLYFCRPETFVADFEAFLDLCPADWDMIQLGGQHMGQSPEVVPGVVKCLTTQRTHCYLLKGRAIGALYEHWSNTANHIDHAFPSFMSRFKCYAPSPFLVGQDAGKSDVNAADNPKKLWRTPRADPPVYWFRNTPRETIELLRSNGFHFGRCRDKRGEDVGLDPIWGECNWRLRPTRLRNWLSMIDWESASEECVGTAIWSEKADERLIREICGDRLVELDNPSVEQATEALKLHGGSA